MDVSKMTADLSFLSRLNLFKNVALESLEIYLEHFKIIDIKAEEILIDPAKENRNIYSLLSGCLQIHFDSVTKSPFMSLEPGDCVGEMSIIQDQRPSAYVIASEDSRLLKIDQDTLWAMVNESHGIARNLLYILSGRVRHDNLVIADSLEMKNRYQNYAMVDKLTGLHNRRWMDDMFDREIKRCGIENEPLCMAMMDIDHFKHFNDQYGHPAGDKVLFIIAATLQKHLRPGDMLVRYGGEEFALLIPKTTVSEALTASERLRKAIAELTIGKYKSRTLPRVTISIGIAQIQSGDTCETLLENADAALYRAKMSGRNCVSQ